MCTETFRRLPEEKRTRFLDAAWEEFTSVPFADASINQIVRRAGVPRGSFYQYFNDKEALFSFLMEQVQTHFVEEYREMARLSGGDIFDTQVQCFDRFVHQGIGGDLLFGRCIQILRLNSGLHLRMMTIGRPECPMLAAMWDQIDLAVFRRRDPDYIQQIFLLALLALAAAVMDTLECPENVSAHRLALLTRLEIIKNGSLAKTPA